MKTFLKISLLVAPLLLTGCRTIRRSTPGTYEEHEYSEIAHLKLSYEDIFNVNEDSYFVYFYQETCADCGLVKNAVIDFALNCSPKIYFVEVNSSMLHTYSYQDIDKTIGTDNYLNVFVGVTPQLATMYQHKVSDNCVGAIKVEYTLSTYRNI